MFPPGGGQNNGQAAPRGRLHKRSRGLVRWQSCVIVVFRDYLRTSTEYRLNLLS